MPTHLLHIDPVEYLSRFKYTQKISLHTHAQNNYFPTKQPFENDYTGSKCTTYSGAKCTTHSG